MRESQFYFKTRKDISNGEKLVDAALLSLPYRIVVSEKTIKNNKFELRERRNRKVKLMKLSDFDKIVETK